MSAVFGWVLAIGIPALIAAGIIQDGRAQAAHDRYMSALRSRRGAVGQEGVSFQIGEDCVPRAKARPDACDAAD